MSALHVCLADIFLILSNFFFNQYGQDFLIINAISFRLNVLCKINFVEKSKGAGRYRN